MLFLILSTTLLDEVYQKWVWYEQYVDVTNVNLSAWYVNDVLLKIIWLISQTSLLVWVAIFIYWWIRFILSQWDYSKMKKARTDLIIAGAWIFIVLLSYAIITLIKTVTKWISF